MPGSTYLYIHDKDSEKIRRHRRYAKFSLFVTYKASFKYHIQNDAIKKSRFYSKIYNYLFGFKNDLLHLQTSNSYLTGNEEFLILHITFLLYFYFGKNRNGFYAKKEIENN